MVAIAKSSRLPGALGRKIQVNATSGRWLSEVAVKTRWRDRGRHVVLQIAEGQTPQTLTMTSMTSTGKDRKLIREERFDTLDDGKDTP